MCDTSILASSITNATVQTLHCANKLIKKLQSEEVPLRFQYLGKDSSLKLGVFSDSSIGNLKVEIHHAYGGEGKILIYIRKDGGAHSCCGSVLYRSLFSFVFMGECVGVRPAYFRSCTQHL